MQHDADAALLFAFALLLPGVKYGDSSGQSNVKYPPPFALSTYWENPLCSLAYDCSHSFHPSSVVRRSSA